jgi:hypothetical protein
MVEQADVAATGDSRRTSPGTSTSSGGTHDGGRAEPQHRMPATTERRSLTASTGRQESRDGRRRRVPAGTAPLTLSVRSSSPETMAARHVEDTAEWR